jgi:hypothetical protein
MQLANLDNKVLASEYKLALPSERRLQDEMTKTMLAIRGRLAGKRGAHHG